MRGKILIRIVVFANNKDARVMAVDRDNQVVQLFKIAVIVGQKNAVLENGMREVNRIIITGEAGVGCTSCPARCSKATRTAATLSSSR